MENTNSMKYKSVTIKELLKDKLRMYRIAQEFSDFRLENECYDFIHMYFPQRHNPITFLVRK